jgi:hypothetical protein
VKTNLVGFVKEWWQGTGETRIFNPYNATIKNKILLDRLYDVKRVRELQLTNLFKSDGVKIFWADYNLGDKHLIVSKDNLTDDLSVVALDKIDEFGYDENFHKAVLMGQQQVDGEWQDDPNAKGDLAYEEIEYRRVEGVTEPLFFNVREAVDEDGSGKVSTNEIREYQVTYWDYYRENEHKEAEFIFVEMNNDTGYFTIWRGVEINRDTVKVL